MVTAVCDAGIASMNPYSFTKGTPLGSFDQDSVITGGGGGDPCVVPLAMFERAPNAGLAVGEPRKAMTWKSYCVPLVSPTTVQVSEAPMVVPLTGVAHVPAVMLEAAPQLSGGRATRTSYDAGAPVPSST